MIGLDRNLDFCLDVAPSTELLAVAQNLTNMNFEMVILIDNRYILFRPFHPVIYIPFSVCVHQFLLVAYDH